MARAPGAGGSRDRDRLLRMIRKVRNRWRVRTLLRGLAALGVAALVVLLATAYGLEFFRFSSTAVLAFRIGSYFLLAVVAWVELIRPLTRRVDDRRIALYLEENEPSLKASVLTAVETAKLPRDALVERLVRDALALSHAVEYGERVERGRLYRYSGLLAAVGVAGVFVFLLGPASLRSGASALLFPRRSAGDLTPFSIEVTPGDTTVAKGSDLIVKALPRGFQSGDVELVLLDADGGVQNALPMFPGEKGGFEHALVDLDHSMRYFVRSSGVSSPTYSLEVAALPYVQRLDLVYHFPAYTGLDPQTVEDGGNIAVLPGTRVEFRATSTIPTQAGRLVLDDSTQVELHPDSSGLLVGEMTVGHDGGYRVELERMGGQMGSASPHYSIDLLSDLPPTVEFEKPGRDSQASPLDEVFVQVRGRDDYGLSSLDLVYSVNGGAADTVSLLKGGGKPATDVSAGHTFFLENFDVVPGDVVSYYAVARDNDKADGPRQVVSDIYFLGIRPFEKNYSASQQGGGGGGGGGGMNQSDYVNLERQIVAATFNLVRDKTRYPADQWRSDLEAVSHSQERLKGDVSTLVGRMKVRLSSAEDQAFKTIAEELPKAVDAMGDALRNLDEGDAQAALSPEQQALLHLQRADEAYKNVRVSLQQGGGGGGGGGASPQAEDLADLFELELDRLRDQYETVQRGQNQATSQKLDETMEKLKELARRQQQEAERQARRLSSGAGSSSSSSASQQKLADDTEAAARQLERLAREQNQPDLQETARQLRQAADAMRKAAASGQQDAASAAQRAADQLDAARRRLEEGRSAQLQKEVDDALSQAQRLRQEQEQMKKDVRDYGKEDAQKQQKTIGDLGDRKDAMAKSVSDLAQQLDRTAAQARQENRKEAAGPIEDAAGKIREDKLEEKIRFSRALVAMGDSARSNQFEGEIGQDLDSLVTSLQKASRIAQAGADNSTPLEKALDQARTLARGMETLDRRLQQQRDGTGGERTAQADQGQQARNGQQGQNGQQSQSGQQQSQSGQQQGQSGQQGQQGGQQAGQQGGQQGQQGGQQGQQGGQQGQQGGQQGQQGGQQGQQGAQAGNQGGGGGGPGGYVGGAWNGGGRWDPNAVRQFTREYGQRARDAVALRDQLRRQGVDTRELDQAIDALGKLSDGKAFDDLAKVLSLQRVATESVQRLEFALRRQVEADGEPALRVPGPDEVPPGFRKAVEDYYKALADGRASGGDR